MLHMPSSDHRLRLLALVTPTLLSLSCSLFAVAPPTISPNCDEVAKPTDADLEFVLRFPHGAFDSSDWRPAFEVLPASITATWLNDSAQAVAHINYLIYDCGYNQSELDANFGEENLGDVIFHDYQEVTSTASCSTQGGETTLHELSAKYEGIDFQLRLWVVLDGETRVLSMAFAFPGDRTEELNRYAQAVFPELPECPD